MPERVVVQATPSQRDALRRYLEELERWNRRINLTSIPRHDAWRRHVEESASLLALLALRPSVAVVDVGAGAGAPGLVMSVLRPDLRMTLLEADARKAAFLDHVAGLIGLGATRVLRARAEDAGRDPAHRARYDLAVSRAAAPPAVLCELALPLVRRGGRMAAMVGDAPAAAEAGAAASAALGGAAPAAAGPTVLVVDKIADTPARYPRRSGVPRRRPLG